MPLTFSLVANPYGRYAVLGSDLVIAPGVTLFASIDTVVVRATDENGWSREFAYEVTIEQGPPIVPFPPRELKVVPGDRSGSLVWTRPVADGGAPITGYLVETSTSNGATWTIVAADTASSATTYRHTEATNGVLNLYRVSAINAIGVGAASAAAGITPATTLDHVVLYGQSLSVGSDPRTAANQLVIVTPENSPRHLMFVAGVRVHYDQLSPATTSENRAMIPDGLLSVVPLREKASPSYFSFFGETLASGMGVQMSRPSLFSSTGAGAHAVKSLSRIVVKPDGSPEPGDTSHFSNTYEAMRHGRDRADENNQAYRVAAFVWKQGEQDALDKNDGATYKAAVKKVRDDLRKAARNAAHYAAWRDIPFLTDQVAFTQDSVAYGRIAVAAIEMHREGTLTVVGPTYDCEYTANLSDVHLTYPGYRKHGERWGRILETVGNGGAWNPCHIRSVRRSGMDILLKVHVPVPPLVHDGATFASRLLPSKGFAYTGAAIQSVTITADGTASPDNEATIRITLASAVAGTLRYAYENARNDVKATGGGEIRDSEPAVTLYGAKNLWNWLCIDEWKVD